MINDFQANGYGVQLIGPESYEVLAEGEPVVDGTIGVLGAGTGLGEGYVAKSEGEYRVFACEGGHTEFPA